MRKGCRFLLRGVSSLAERTKHKRHFNKIEILLKSVFSGRWVAQLVKRGFSIAARVRFSGLGDSAPSRASV